MKYDFTEVMREWRRMCDTCSVDPNCTGCGIKPELCGAIWEINTDKLYDIAESITDWSKANPPKQYPSWGELIRRYTGLSPVEVNGMKLALNLQIPKDIAEKLEIEPE